MVLNGRFTRINLREDREAGTTLLVEGTSDPPDMPNQLHVALIHGGELLSAPVDQARATAWMATFTEGASPFEPGDDVLVIGVATGASPEPFVWHNSFTIE